jgi:F0F1-type ATP synthase assembly protein I
MGIQLAVSIGLGVLAGMRVDEHLELNQPLGTAALALFGLAVGMVQILRALKS